MTTKMSFIRPFMEFILLDHKRYSIGISMTFSFKLPVLSITLKQMVGIQYCGLEVFLRHCMGLIH